MVPGWRGSLLSSFSAFEDIGDLTNQSVVVRMIPDSGAVILIERRLGHNFFGPLGNTMGVDFREGRYRAHGPFAHAILAGTIGATCLPIAVGVWTNRPRHALAGILSAISIVIAAGSSGPIMMGLFALSALALWRLRSYIRAVFWLAIAGIVALDIFMKDPVYFLMARIDITGGSTGWFRAQLMRSALQHLNEWWLVGTDYTRHWMPSGLSRDSQNTDITNHYLQMGVLGGLPLMFLFIMIMVVAFRRVGRAVNAPVGLSKTDQFVMWTLGSALFGNAMNFFGISLFDQSSTAFFCLILAMISAVKIEAVSSSMESSQMPRRAGAHRMRQFRGPAKTTVNRRTPLSLDGKVVGTSRRPSSSVHKK